MVYRTYENGGLGAGGWFMIVLITLDDFCRVDIFWISIEVFPTHLWTTLMVDMFY